MSWTWDLGLRVGVWDLELWCCGAGGRESGRELGGAWGELVRHCLALLVSTDRGLFFNVLDRTHAHAPSPSPLLCAASYPVINDIKPAPFLPG